MDAEHITILRSIDTQVSCMLWVVGCAGLAYLINMVLKLRQTLPGASHKSFDREAERYFEEGRLEALTNLCEERLRTRPNSAEALWWCARGHYELRHYAVAQERFAKLAHIEPSWHEDVSPYLENIERKAQTFQ
ncbi:MAG: hypothetical protein AAFV69_06840 [Pseudomonadota bacterium]